MDHQGELGRLEGIVERLLASFDVLKKANKLLEEKVQNKEVEIHQLRKEISVLTEEKQHIYKRVDSLLATIEKWEKERVETAEKIEKAFRNFIDDQGKCEL